MRLLYLTKHFLFNFFLVNLIGLVSDHIHFCPHTILASFRQEIVHCASFRCTTPANQMKLIRQDFLFITALIYSTCVKVSMQ